MPNHLRFQLLSDLHLETPLLSPSYTTLSISVSAPNLLLLGDIGQTIHPQLFHFLTSLLTTHPSLRIFYLLGNHEAYGTTLEVSIARLEEYQREAERKFGEGRFVFMNRTRVDVDEKVTVLGCTLWSDISPGAARICATSLKDFDDEKGIWDRTVEQHNADHALDLDWLNSTITHISTSEPEREIIVLTHHSPTLDSRANNPRHKKSSVQEGFVTDLRGELCWKSERVKVWGFGHTHWSCQFYCGDGEGEGKLVVANQRGYGKRECMVMVVERGKGGWRVVVGGKEVVQKKEKEVGETKEKVVEEVESGNADVPAHTEPKLEPRQRQSDTPKEQKDTPVDIAPARSKSSWGTKLKRALHIS